MPSRCPGVLAAVAAFVSLAAPAAGQPTWVQVTAPHVTVASDAGAGRARDIAWQFEQVHQGLSGTFPWIRWNLSRPLLVLAARNETSMKALVPGTFARPDGRLFTAVASTGRDRAYVALRADVRIDDVEGVNPYQSAYWAYASQALGETFTGLPLWLRRGLAEFMSNSLVRDKEIQIGRVLPQNLRLARGMTRLGLRELVELGDDDTRTNRPQFLADVDATAWAFVHFLMFGDDGAHQPEFNEFVAGLLKGGNPQTLLASTLGDVNRHESAFNVYVNREIFGFARFEVSARLSREGFPVQPLPAAQALLLRAAHHVSTNELDAARALVAEARKADPSGGDEVEALLADREGGDADVRTSLEKAVKSGNVSWYAPYRLATLLSTTDQASLERIETLLDRATTLNPYADGAWAFLAEVMVSLDRGSAALVPIDKALALVPASSRHHISRARVLRRLGRAADASRAAGIGRALARTPEERERAQGMLADLARDALQARAAADASKAASASSESAPAPDGAPAGREAATPGPGGSPAIDLASLVGATRPAVAGSIGTLIGECYANPATCRKVLPDIAGDCNTGGTPTSPGACRNAGYILDAGIGVAAAPVMAADFYRKGCARKDEISCVRLATLQATGRGVPRDVAGGVAVLEASCKNDVQEACFRLGVHLSSTKAPADLARARDVLSASCKAEFAESCAWLKKLPPG